VATPLDATAFPRRDMAYVLALVAAWKDPANSEALVRQSARLLAKRREDHLGVLHQLRGD
jgi:hypothetical protein